MTCVEGPSSDWASGLLQHSRVTTLAEVLAGDDGSLNPNASKSRGIVHQEPLLSISTRASQKLTQASFMSYSSSYSELTFIGLLCVLISVAVIAICMTALLVGKQRSSAHEEKLSTGVPSSSNLDLRPLLSRAPVLASPDDEKGLLLTARKCAQARSFILDHHASPLVPGIDILDAGGLHLLHFTPGPTDSQKTRKGACCSLHIGAGGPLLASVEVGGGIAVFRDSKGAIIGRLEAAGAGSYALDGLGSCRSWLRGVFKDRSVTLVANGGLLASTEIPPGVPNTTRPAEPDVAVCVAPGVDAGLVLCAALAADWLEAALQGRKPAAPWGCAFPEYFQHRLNLVADQQS